MSVRGRGSAERWTWATAVIVLLVDRFVIAREEAYLRTRFGADYDDFSARTRRWL